MNNPLKKEKKMTLEEAIRTAIDYEVQARNAYQQAAESVSDPIGNRILKALADDEQLHVQYLKQKLDQWKQTGKITVEKLKSVIPPRETFLREFNGLKDRMAEAERGGEKQILSEALKMEMDASRFYKKLVEEMSDEAQQMFANFLEIEERHVSAVQAELDYFTKSGYWFDFKEFDME
jgi:rubrerythrin